MEKFTKNHHGSTIHVTEWSKTVVTIVFAVEKLHGIGPTVAEKTQRKWPKNAAKSTSDGVGTVDRQCRVVRRRARARRPPRPLGRRWAAEWLCVMPQCDHNFLLNDFSANSTVKSAQNFDTKAGNRKEIWSIWHSRGHLLAGRCGERLTACRCRCAERVVLWCLGVFVSVVESDTTLKGCGSIWLTVGAVT